MILLRWRVDPTNRVGLLAILTLDEWAHITGSTFNFSNVVTCTEGTVLHWSFSGLTSDLLADCLQTLFRDCVAAPMTSSFKTSLAVPPAPHVGLCQQPRPASCDHIHVSACGLYLLPNLAGIWFHIHSAFLHDPFPTIKHTYLNLQPYHKHVYCWTSYQVQGRRRLGSRKASL